jgi:hypothetical protein
VDFWSASTAARQHYFPELTQQITRIQGPDGLRLAIFDEPGCAGGGPPLGNRDAPISTRSLPALFFDPTSPASIRRRISAENWTAEATVVDDRALLDAPGADHHARDRRNQHAAAPDRLRAHAPRRAPISG